MDLIIGKITGFGYNLIDKGAIPDWILRSAVRYLCRVRLSSLPLPDSSYTSHAYYKSAFVSSLKSLPSITAPESTRKANNQHYEVSTTFILSCLGPRAKYSACLWERDGPNDNLVKTLADAEEAIMELYCARASLTNGMDILDLGCGQWLIKASILETLAFCNVHRLGKPFIVSRRGEAHHSFNGSMPHFF